MFADPLETMVVRDARNATAWETAEPPVTAPELPLHAPT